MLTLIFVGGFLIWVLFQSGIISGIIGGIFWLSSVFYLNHLLGQFRKEQMGLDQTQCRKEQMGLDQTQCRKKQMSSDQGPTRAEKEKQ